MKIKFPYGKEFLEQEFGSELSAVLESSINKYTPECSETELVKKAMEAPVGTPRLSELAKGKKNVVIIASDHTRPVLSLWQNSAKKLWKKRKYTFMNVMREKSLSI